MLIFYLLNYFNLIIPVAHICNVINNNEFKILSMFLLVSKHNFVTKQKYTCNYVTNNHDNVMLEL